MLSLGCATTSAAARWRPDLVIMPRAGGVGLLECHQLHVAVEAVRVAARVALEDAPGSLFTRRIRAIRGPSSARSTCRSLKTETAAKGTRAHGV